MVKMNCKFNIYQKYKISKMNKLSKLDINKLDKMNMKKLDNMKKLKKLNKMNKINKFNKLINVVESVNNIKKECVAICIKHNLNTTESFKFNNNIKECDVLLERAKKAIANFEAYNGKVGSNVMINILFEKINSRMEYYESTLYKLQYIDQLMNAHDGLF
jgi:hypothetical protein